MNIDISIPDGSIGDYTVETFVVSEKDAQFENMRAMFSFGSRPIDPGTYKRLTRGHTTVMSNTPCEIDDHREFIYKSEDTGGDILMNGLGLGVALTAILKFKNINSVTIVEKSKEVIDLVGMFYAQDDRVKIINNDAFDYKPTKRFTVVWHDIWDNICADNLIGMHKLHRKYGKRTDWQGSWCRYECERLR